VSDTPPPLTDFEKRLLKKRTPKEYVYRHHCGSELFYLMAGGRPQCLECGENSTEIIWGQLGVGPDRMPPSAAA
jgi:hypothetical protein